MNDHNAASGRFTLPSGGGRGLHRFGAALLAVLSILFSGLHLHLAFHRYQALFETEAIKLAESLEALLPRRHIFDLVEQPDEGEALDYHLVKEKLLRLVEKTDLIHYAYLIAEEDGEIILLADSNPNEASAHSPPGNLTEELSESSWVPFETEYSILSKPIHNQWGTWIRVLVPVHSPENGDIIAILGLSYSAEAWNAGVWGRMAPDILVTLCILALFFSLLLVLTKHRALRDKSRQLALSEELYRGLFHQAPIGIILNDYKSGKLHSEFSSINPTAQQILGRSAKDLNTMDWKELTHAEDLAVESSLFDQFKNRENEGYSLEKRILRPDGSNTWVNIKISSFIGGLGSDFTYLCLIEDISVRRAAEAALAESERSKEVLLSHLPGMAYRVLYDQNRTLAYVSTGCLELTGYSQEQMLSDQGLYYKAMIPEEYSHWIREANEAALSQKNSYRYEYELITKTGDRKWVLELGQGVYDQTGQVEALEGILLDISEQKRREAQITYLGEHDFLTGLYSRSYLEREKLRLKQSATLPLSVIVCDINGLRMINDAYGHVQGDRLIIEVAKLLQGCCRAGDVVGRTGGGEFMLLLPGTDSKAGLALATRIQDTVESYHRAQERPLYELSLSIGCSTWTSELQTIEDVVKLAENFLKHRKILNQKSLHHSILSSIMATLYAKSQETEAHGQRLGRYAVGLGERLGLDQKALDELRLLSMLHDIGKVGIDDRILNKPGRLTGKEWEHMKTHPEIGHRIAMSTPELAHIAAYILHHHERWDGTGYPMGLSGLAIPLSSRILAVVDAYDAMRKDRVYRQALSPEAAMAELRQGAGTQFDPDITALFIQMVTGDQAHETDA